MRKFLLVCALILGASKAHAGLIVLAADSNINSSNNSIFFSNVFGGQNVVGLNSSFENWALDNWDSVATTSASSYSQIMNLTSSDLTGTDWLIAASASSYSATTMSLIQNFLINGGNVWIGGEASVYGAFSAANQLLGFLGSSMSLNSVATTAYNTTSNTNLDVLTAGTSTFFAGYQSTVSGGTALYANNGNAVVSVDRTTFANQDNDTTDVPAPASLGLLGIALLAMRRFRRS